MVGHSPCTVKRLGERDSVLQNADVYSSPSHCKGFSIAEHCDMRHRRSVTPAALSALSALTPRRRPFTLTAPASAVFACCLLLCLGHGLPVVTDLVICYRYRSVLSSPEDESIATSSTSYGSPTCIMTRSAALADAKGSGTRADPANPHDIFVPILH